MNLDFETRTVGRMGFDAAGHFTVIREYDCVTLHIPVSVTIDAERTPTWLCRDIHLDLCGVQPGGAERLICSGPMLEVLQAYGRQNTFNRRVALRCTPKAIAEYERERNGGPPSVPT
jgi:hypothetical protein